MSRKRISGFSLIEILVAMFVLTIAILWSSQAILNNMKIEKQSSVMDQVSQLVRSRIDQYRGHIQRGEIRVFLLKPDWKMGETVTVNTHEVLFGRHYLVQTDTTWLEGDPTDHNLFEIKVAVWQTNITDLEYKTPPEDAPPYMEAVTRMAESIEGEL